MADSNGVLPKQPLFYVLASVRVQPWMALPSKISDIQDTLRDRFPLLNQIVMEQFSQQPGFGNIPFGHGQPSPTAQPSAWAFHTADRTIGCQISMDQIVVHALTYSRFSEFAETIRFVLSTVEKYARHFDAGAIGIRYLDKIAPDEGEQLSNYLPDAFLPKELKAPGLEAVGGMNQTIYKTKDGVLHARFWTGNGYAEVPDDLIPLYVMTQDLSGQGAFLLKTLEPGHGTLDSDSIWTSQQPIRMNTDDVIETLKRLHSHANGFFRSVCSGHAFEVWGKESP